jgi:hypothetical protein
LRVLVDRHLALVARGDAGGHGDVGREARRLVRDQQQLAGPNAFRHCHDQQPLGGCALRCGAFHRLSR